MAQVEEHWRIEESEYVDYDQLQFNDEGVVHLKSSHRELSFISVETEISLAYILK